MLVGAHAIMADGGIVARVGTLLVALAAKRFRVPFVVLAGLHKLCPVFADESHIFMYNDTRVRRCLDYLRLPPTPSTASGDPLLAHCAWADAPSPPPLIYIHFFFYFFHRTGGYRSARVHWCLLPNWRLLLVVT